ncbi:MAG TPA: ATP-dependent helicase HrpB, partial [Gammaproteobacteria bacterium]
MSTPLLEALRAALPVGGVLGELERVLGERQVAVLEAPPGAGKTTLAPLALREAAWLDGQRILLLEPRRLAARAAAERMAALLGEAVGQTVGYRVRLESRVSAATRVEVVTEGILTRQLQADPALDGVGLVIFDEFHERSLDGDLGLALALQSRELLREEPPLRLLVMSATLDGSRVARLLGDAPVVRSQGRQYPVELRYGAPWRPDDDVVARTATTLRQVLADEHGSVLVFLPGQQEIRRVAERVADLAGPGLELLPLHGDLDLARQRRVIEPPPAGTRKVVLATAIAETSLTIDGVRVVIDAGLSRQPRFDPPSGMTRLHTGRLSRASSEQRAGRAGRLEPGVCYRLWAESQQAELLPFTPAEVLQADLAPLALQLLRWGVTDPAELRWLDPPPAAPYAQALDLLQRLGAALPRDGGWRLTAHGAAMATLPAHPRLAHLLLTGAGAGLLEPACALAALLAERDPLRERDADLQLRLDLFAGNGLPPALRGVQRRLQQLAGQFRRLCTAHAAPAAADAGDPRWSGFLLAQAYPDRVAQRRGADASYRLSNGRAARLLPGDPLQRASYLAVAEVGGRSDEATDRIHLAAELDPALFDDGLAALVDERDAVDWDAAGDRFRAERQRRLGALVLATRPLARVPTVQRTQVLLDFVRREGLGLLDWNDGVEQLRGRVALLRRLEPERGDGSTWPDLGDAALLARLDEWLAPALARVRRRDDFRALDTRALLLALLPWPLPQRLDELAPERLRVPSGSQVRIDYAVDPPVLAVKLQEMFGCAETPRVAGGRVALSIHLLSPARRPLQVTRDLASFWQNGYAEVRKEMRGRYPKHPWP